MTPVTDRTGKLLTLSSNVSRCSSCHTIKPRTEFYKDKNRAPGISSRCIACDRARLANLPVRTFTSDLNKLAARHPAFSNVIADIVGRVAAA